MKKDYVKYPYLLITIAIFLVAAFAFISFQLSARVKNIESEVSKKQEIIMQLHNIQNALLYNETNTKSYVITPTPQLEVLLKEVPDLIRSEINKLGTYFSNKSNDKRENDSLLFFANKRIEYSGNVIRIRKESGFNAALAFMNISSEKYYISKTRMLINNWSEKESLEQKNDLIARKKVLNNFNLVLLSIFIFVLILGGIYLLQLQKNINQRAKEIENAKYLETVLNTISEPVITTDANFKIQAWNKAAERVYGLDVLLSKEADIAVAVHSQIANEDRLLVRNEMKKNGFWKGEVKHLNAEGQEIFVQSLTSALVDKNGKLTGFVSANRDVTDERLAQDMIRKFNQDLAEQVKEKTAELTSIFERVSDAFVALDTNWKYSYVNKRAEQLFNKPDGYLIGKHIWTEFPEGIGQPFHLAYQKALKDQAYIYLEEYYPPYDRWFENHIYPSPSGLSIYFRDITDKKKAENALKESEIKYRTLIEQASDAIFITDDNGIYIDVNTSGCELVGYTREELSNLSITDLVVVDENFIPFRFAELKAGKSVIQTRKLLKKDGSEILVEIHTKLLDNGKMLGIARDLTERIEAEEQLQKEKDLSDKIINSLPGIFYLSDPSPKMIRWNKDFEIVSGYSAEELSKMVPITLFVAEDHLKVRGSLEKTYKEGQATVEARLLTKSGKTIPYYFTGVRVEFQGRMAMLGTGIDMSEQKKTEEEKNRLLNTIQKSLDQIYIFNTESLLFEYANDGGLNNLGYTLDEFVKLTPLDIKPDFTLKKFNILIRPLLEKEKGKIIFETTHKRKDNSLFPVEVHLQLIEEGGSQLFLAITRDITERKNQQQKIEKEFRENEALINSTSDILWSVDTDYKLISANDSFVRNVNENGGPLLKRGDNILFKDLLQDEYLQYWKNIYDKGLSGEKQRTEIYTPQAQSSDFNWFELIANPIYINDKVTGIACSMRDITERKKISEALKQSEESYRVLVENAPEALVVFDVETTKFVSISDSAVILFKMTKDELLKLGPVDVSPEYQPNGVLSSEAAKEIIKAALDGDKFSFEWLHSDKEGNLIPCEVRLVKLPSETNILLRGSIIDISERKKADEKIRKSNERFELIGKATNDAIWEWNLETNEIWGNEEHQQLYGLTMADPVPGNDKWEDRLHTDDKERVIKTVAEALASDQSSFEAEYRLFTENRNWINVYGSTYIERNKEGKAIRLLGNMTDITERKQREQQLKLLESVITNTNDAVMITEAEPFDEPGPKIVYVNAAFCKMTGYTESEVIGKTPRILQGPNSDRKELNRMKDSMKKWKPCEITIINYKKNGEEFWINISISPVANEKGWFTHWISIDKDVTERKNEEKHLRDSEERLRLSLKAANQGLYDVNVQTGEAIVNDQYALMLGYDPDTFVETNSFWLERVHPDDLAQTSQAYQDYIQGKSSEYRIEFRQKAKDNTWKWILSIGKIVENDAEGKPQRMLGTHTDITERKKVEEALQNAKNRLRFLLTATPAVIYSSEAKYPYGATFVSENIKKQTGYEPDNFINDPDFWSDHIHPEEKQKVLKNLSNLHEKGHYIHEYRFRIKDGNYVWIQDEVILIFDKDGKPKETVGYWININERKKAEESLAESENRLRTIYNTEPECIKMLNSEGELLEMNPAGLDMIEADSIEQVKGRSIFNIIDKDYRKSFIRLIKDVFNHKSGTLKFSITGLKGTKRWMETHAVPMKNPGGEIIALLGVTMDITHKRKAEIELKENEEKYRTLVEQAVDAIALYDMSGKILDVNTGAVDLLGYSKDELMKMYLPEILTEEEIKMKPVRYDLLKKGDSTIKRRVMRKKDGDFVQTEVRSQQLPNGRFLSVIRDLTERIQAEKDLEESYQAIRKLTSHIQNVREEERTSIAREIHDELGQQLTVMKMDVSWLKKEVGVKNESVNLRLKELISMLDETVKSVRRISSELRPSLLDDLGLAAAMEWQLQEFEKRSGINTRFITSKAELKLPVEINTALYRIFQESMTNVARHSKAKNVTVNLAEKDNQLILSIADDGKGFDKREIADKKTLGILGMKERTSMIDGLYQIESIPDKGTIATVTILLTKNKN